MSDGGEPRLSGRQIAPQYVERFKSWIVERESAGDWDDYVRFDKLNRSEIAKECDFLRSVFRTNPGVERTLVDLEARLRAEGVLPAVGGSVVASGTDPGSGNADLESGRVVAVGEPAAELALRRAIGAKANAEKRAKALEAQNATLRAEVNHLRDQVRKLNFMDDQLARTGRLPRP